MNSRPLSPEPSALPNWRHTPLGDASLPDVAGRSAQHSRPMSVEQIVFALAGSICAVGAVVAVVDREPRMNGAALAVTLLSLAVFYAALAAPVPAGAALALAVFLTVPLVVHLTIAAPRRHAEDGPPVAGASLLIGAGLLGILLFSIVIGEVASQRLGARERRL